MGRQIEGQRGRQENGLYSHRQRHEYRQREMISALCTFIVDLETDRAHTLIRLEMEPHLMGHADNQVWDKAPSQPAESATKESLRHKNPLLKYCLISKLFSQDIMSCEMCCYKDNGLYSVAQS